MYHIDEFTSLNKALQGEGLCLLRFHMKVLEVLASSIGKKKKKKNKNTKIREEDINCNF